MTYKQRILAHINDPDISRWIIWDSKSQDIRSYSYYGRLQEYSFVDKIPEFEEFIDGIMVPALSCGKIVLVTNQILLDGHLSCLIGNETSQEWKLNQLQQALDL